MKKITASLFSLAVIAAIGTAVAMKPSKNLSQQWFPYVGGNYSMTADPNIEENCLQSSETCAGLFEVDSQGNRVGNVLEVKPGTHIEQ